MTNPRQANREKKRKQKAFELLGAAERLVKLGTSISAITVDMLRQEAGMARSTFYVYFEDKIDLISTLMEHIFEETLDPVTRWWNVTEHRTQKELIEVLLEAGKVLQQNQVAYQMIEESALYDDHLKASIDKVNRSTIQLAQKAVKKEQKGGSIRTDVTPEMVEDLHWMTNRVLTYKVISQSSSNLSRHCTSLASIMWRTLYDD
ncbi:TetR/AcrR family transcriptional regulator [Maricurvus nonylphenolicus]|uniref:TetR/AcrR family transcriptional regulator n=1 Tax=Maricurvus nonylphenolicus TaxID=1008307 RepID=UPI0036F25E79